VNQISEIISLVRKIKNPTVQRLLAKKYQANEPKPDTKLKSVKAIPSRNFAKKEILNKDFRRNYILSIYSDEGIYLSKTEQNLENAINTLKPVPYMYQRSALMINRTFKTMKEDLEETLNEELRSIDNRCEEKALNPNGTQAYDQNQLDILTNWYNDHINNPYPSKAEKRRLAYLINLNPKQVAIWFGNRRNRTGHHFVKPDSGIKTAIEVKTDPVDLEIMTAVEVETELS